jgi:hypothetical protein
VFLSSHRKGEGNLVGVSYRVFKYIPFQGLEASSVDIDAGSIDSYAV